MLLSSATENRLRAFTLLVRSYDAVRRAIAYLRWRQGDSDHFAPSLWAGRGGRGKSPLGAEPPASVEPLVVEQTPGAPATPAASTDTEPVAPSATSDLHSSVVP